MCETHGFDSFSSLFTTVPKLKLALPSSLGKAAET